MVHPYTELRRHFSVKVRFFFLGRVSGATHARKRVTMKGSICVMAKDVSTDSAPQPHCH